MPTTYKFYHALDVDKQQIRLLEVMKPATSTQTEPVDRVQCRLHTVSLLDRPVFTTLSYRWGDQTSRENIVVEGEVFPTTSSLASALKFVRAHWQHEFPDRDASSFRIWVDGICINQNDLDERSHQVELMKSVYSESELTFAWLGQQLEGIDDAFYICETVHKELEYLDSHDYELEWLQKYPRLTASGLLQDDHGKIDSCEYRIWLSMADLIQLSYWGRVWVFQELVLAQNILLIHGTKSLSYHHFIETLGFMDPNARKQTVTINNDKFVDLRFVDWIGFIRSSVPTRVFDLIEGAKHFIKHQQQHQSPENMEKEMSGSLFRLFVSVAASAACSDIRDRVYGLLGVFHLNIIPNYRQDLAPIMLEWTNVWLERVGHPTFLEFSGIGLALAEDSSLPSWVPCLGPKAWEETSSSTVAAIQQFDGNCYYNVFDTDCCSVISRSSLYTTALVGPLISCAYNRKGRASSHDIEFLADALIEGHPDGISGVHPAMALLQVLTCKRLSDHDILRYAMGFFRSLQTSEPDAFNSKYRDVFLNGIPGLPRPLISGLYRSHYECAPTEGESEEARKAMEKKMFNLAESQYMELVHRYIRSRATYDIVEFGGIYLALAPKHIEQGDRLAIIPGCGAPVVLRPMQDHYLHVGTSYVAGLMDGEAAEWIQNGTAMPEQIEIH